MWDRTGRVGSIVRRMSRTNDSRGSRPGWRPLPEVLENRRLLTASLQPIANFSVPAQQGYTLPLDGSGTTDDQTFTVTQTSGDPNIVASVAQGDFWTLNSQYTDPSDTSDNFSGALTFQLFQTLTPNTVSEIEEFTNDGYYNDTNFIRIASGFPGTTDDIVQGGSTIANETSPSGQPGTPFLNENVQQLAFTGQDQLAMANGGVDTSQADYTQGVNTNGTQFFVTTTGSPNAELGYGYTIFGQLVSGLNTLTQMAQVPLETQANPAYGGEDSEPVNPLVLNSASLSTGNPNGVLIIDTTQASAGDSATFMVTAHDATDDSSVSQSFTVTVGAYAGPTDPAIDFKPLSSPVTATVKENGASTAVTLAGQDGYPDPTDQGTLTYSLVSQPGDGTFSDFDASTGTFDYTPDPGFSGTDTFQYQVQQVGPAPQIGSTQENGQTVPLYGPAATTTSDATAVTITVTPTPRPTITWAAPVNIVYGTALTARQLDATASVPGTFTYSPPLGTVLKAGSGQTLSVTFTPQDTAEYGTATDTTTINVAHATPTATWATPTSIVPGTPLGSTQLDATATWTVNGASVSVAGTYSYSPALGTVLPTDDGQTLSVIFTPTDTADYTTAPATTTIDVAKAAPTITWATPASIVYGTALSAKQLDATASVPGTFTYSPPLGTILQVGNDQTLSVTFTPTNSAAYTTSRDATTINVMATPQSTGVSTTSTPLVTVTGIQLEENRKRQVDEILVTLSGPVDASEADSTATYHLTTAGKKGSFTAKDASIIRLSSASYDAANDTIALIPKKPFALSKKVQLVVYGGPPSGLQDSQGRYIDGNDDGQAGGNVVRILSRSGVSLDAVAMASPSVGSISATNEIDVLLAQSALDGLIHAPAAREHRD
jgi:cyclophilin family peptidyl-prolyl cis-trans isomerase